MKTPQNKRAGKSVSLDTSPARTSIENDRSASFSRVITSSSENSRDDRLLVRSWLHGKAAGTQKWYAREARDFLDFVGTGLQSATIKDLQGYAESLLGFAESTQARKLAAIKSLFSYATKIGYLERNWGSMLKVPKVRDRLNERILSEDEVARMIDLEWEARDQAILRMLYGAGLRVSELCTARWCDLVVRLDKSTDKQKRAQLTVLGKGNKTRTVILPTSVYNACENIRPPSGVSPSDPIFTAYSAYASGMAGKRRPLSRKTVWRVVKKAGARAGLGLDVSPHWLRHAHASQRSIVVHPFTSCRKPLGMSRSQRRVATRMRGRTIAARDSWLPDGPFYVQEHYDERIAHDEASSLAKDGSFSRIGARIHRDITELFEIYGLSTGARAGCNPPD